MKQTSITRLILIMLCLILNAVLIIAQAPREVIFFEDFESGGLRSMWKKSSSQSTGVISVGDNLSDTDIFDGGFYEVILGKNQTGPYNINYLDLSLKMATYQGKNVALEFWIRDINDDTQPDDGIWVSNDAGKNFKKIFGFKPSEWTNAYGQMVPIDLDALVAKAGLTFTDQFIIRFSQGGTHSFSDYPYDGIGLDDILIRMDEPVFAKLPFSEGFENGLGTFDNYWILSKDNSTYFRPETYVHISRSPNILKSGFYGMALGLRYSIYYGICSADLCLDLEGYNDVKLSFWMKDNNDDNSGDDGLWLSDDGGKQFRKIYAFKPEQFPNEYFQYTLDLDSLAFEQKLSLSSKTVIRFQQSGSKSYGDYSYDGLFFDDISVQGQKSAIKPSIVSFSPQKGSSGTQVEIKGKGFTANTEVYFDADKAIAITFIDAQTIRAIVPVIAKSGKISIKNGGGTSTSIDQFEVLGNRVIFQEDFESATLRSMWKKSSTTADGSIDINPYYNDVGNFYEVLLGKKNTGNYNINNLDLAIPLAAYQGQRVTLEFWIRDINDDTNPEDVVSISNDGGQTFKKIFALNPSKWTNDYGRIVPIDLSAIAKKLEMNFTDNFVIRFQQGGTHSFGDYPYDGIGIDNIIIALDNRSYAPLPYATSFESFELNTPLHTAFPDKTTIIGNIRPENSPQISNWLEAVNTGFAGMLLGNRYSVDFAVNAVDLDLNLENQSKVKLTFWMKDFNDDTDSEDGLWLSNDAGETFKKIYAFNPSAVPNQFINYRLSLDSLAKLQSINFTNKMVLRFQGGESKAYGDYDYDGLFFDDISITGDKAVINCTLISSAATTKAECGKNNGAITLNTTGGTGVISYQWENGKTGNQLTNLAPGVYPVTITDALGCKENLSFTIESTNGGLTTANFNVKVDKLTITCTNTSSNGASYLWNFGDNSTSTETSPSHTYTRAGTYTITLTVKSVCIDITDASFSNTVNVSSGGTGLCTLVITPSLNQPICLQKNGAVLVSVSGGTGAISYKWSNGATTSSINNLEAGNYTLTVSDAAGCSDTKTFTLENNSTKPRPKFSFIVNGLSVTFKNESLNGDTYTWDFGDKEVSTDLNPTHIYKQAGTYIVRLTVRNNCFGDQAEVFTLSVTVVGSSTGDCTGNISLTSGLVAHYPFSGNANDQIGNNNNGLVNGATLTSDRFGNANSAYQFNGVNNYIELPNANGLNVGTTSFSICAWIKTSNNQKRGRVLSKGAAFCSTGYGIRTTDQNGTILSSVASNGNCQVLMPGNKVINDGQWHQIVAVFDRTVNASIYIDGILDVEQKIDLSSFNYNNNQSAFIGFSNDSNAPEYFDGSIDDIRLYLRSLSKCDIEDLYKLESKGITKPGTGTDKAQLYLSKATASASDTARITVRANKFKDIGGFQFSVAIPSGKAKIIGIDNTASFPGLLIRQKAPERWGFVWYDPNLAAKTLPDSTVLVSLKVVFNSNVSENECVPIVFDVDPTDIVVSTLINKEVGEYIPSTANGEVCLLSTAKLKGTITTTAGIGVNAVIVSIGGKISITNDKGEYEMPQLLRGRTYVIKPRKGGSPKNGVNVVDVVTIRQHILGDKIFADPYKYIVSDVNGSGSVNVADVVIIQQLILGQIDSFSRNWVIVPSNYRFSSPAAAIKEKFPEEITISNLDGDKNDLNFIALKIGDANNSASPKSKLIDQPGLSLADLALHTGQKLEIPVYAHELINMKGFQCQLSTQNDGALEILGIAFNEQTQLKSSNFDLRSLESGVLRIMWVESMQSNMGLSEDKPLFLLQVQAKANLDLVKQLYINSTDFENQFVTEDLDWVKGALSFDRSTQRKGVDQQVPRPKIYPNPGSTDPTIEFSLAQSVGYLIEVFTETGIKIKTYSIQGLPGVNQTKLDGMAEFPGGVYQYRINLPGDVLVGKFLMVK